MKQLKLCPQNSFVESYTFLSWFSMLQGPQQTIWILQKNSSKEKQGNDDI